MKETSHARRLEEASELRFSGVKWGPEDKPVLIADGNVHRIKKLNERILAKKSYVVGVNQDSFEKVCGHLNTEIVHFYEMRVADLDSLSKIDGLRELAIEWNTKVTEISKVALLDQLEILSFIDTPKIKDLEPVKKCSNLKAFQYGGGIWNRNTAESLEPLSKLPHLECIFLSNLRVLRDGLRPLSKCTSLRRLSLSNQFPTEDYAYLSVELSKVICNQFKAYTKFETQNGEWDVMITGKRKPFLNSEKDSERIMKYEKAFEKLRKKFESNKTRDQIAGTRSAID